jgi:uncharacterized protein (UPF0332 family)
MGKISWCKKQKKGMSLIKPNNTLSLAYLRKAEESLESIHLNKYVDWKIATLYYSSYFSLYALLSKIGIKLEIHSCTIDFAKEFLDNYFSNEEFLYLSDVFIQRVNTQYYVHKSVSQKELDKLVSLAPIFFLNVKKFYFL